MSFEVQVLCDSSACLGMVNKGFSKALQHIRKLQDVSTRWVKETLEKLRILAQKVSSEDSGADLMTKALKLIDSQDHTRYNMPSSIDGNAKTTRSRRWRRSSRRTTMTAARSRRVGPI